MWIRWKYMDHGWPDWAELEIPNDLDGYETVEEYLIDRRDLHIPTWSERYMSGRIYWQKLTLSQAEEKRRAINRLRAEVAHHKRMMENAQRKLGKYL